LADFILLVNTIFVVFVKLISGVSPPIAQLIGLGSQKQMKKQGSIVKMRHSTALAILLLFIVSLPVPAYSAWQPEASNQEELA
jgi:preprotein translocase subunit SecG